MFNRTRYRTDSLNRSASNEPSPRATGPAVHQATRPVIEALESRQLLSAGDLLQGMLIDFPSLYGDDRAVAATTDGLSIYMVGNGSGRIALAKLSKDGALLSQSLIALPNNALGSVSAVAVDSNRVYVAGSYGIAGSDTSDMMVAAINPSTGELDSSFGVGGMVTYDFNGAGDGASAILINNGEIVVGGYASTLRLVEMEWGSFYEADQDFAMLWLSSTGTVTGSAVTHISDDVDGILALAPHGTNGVVAAGMSGGVWAGKSTVARYANHAMDENFGDDGIGGTGWTIGNAGAASAVAVDDLGRILITGSDFTITRFTGDGLIDETFVASGVNCVQVSAGTIRPVNIGNGATAAALAIDSADRIVVAGLAMSETGFGSDYQVVRLVDAAAVNEPESWAMDTSFGTGTNDGGVSTGEAHVPVGNDEAMVNGLIVTDTGIVVTGFSVREDVENHVQADFAVVALNDSATSFTTSFVNFAGGGDDNVNAMAVQSDGKIIIAGSTFDPTRISDANRFALARYDAAGALDAGFGVGGRVVFDIADSGNESIVAVAVQGDGIIALGTAEVAGQSVIALARFNADGTVDGTFGDGGVVLTAMADDVYASSLLIQPDGKILVGASVMNSADGRLDFAVLRYDTFGDLDSTFGSGYVTYGLQNVDETLGSMALAADGSIVVAGTSGYSAAILRLTESGSAMGDITLFSHAIPDGAELMGSTATSVAIDETGRILVGGGVVYADADFVYHASLAITSLSDEGVVQGSFAQPDIGGNIDTLFWPALRADITIQPDGKILAVGTAEVIDPLYGYPIGTEVVVARYATDGSVDASFGNGGFIRNSLGAETESGTAIAVMPATGNIAVAGTYSPGFGNDMMLLVLENAVEGSGGGGTVTAEITPPMGNEGAIVVDEGSSIILLAGGEYVAGGGVTFDQNLRRAVAGTGGGGGTSVELVYEWDLDYDGLTFTRDLSGTMLETAAPDGPATVTAALRVSYGSLSAIATAGIAVQNVAPIGTIAGPTSTSEGSTVQLQVNAIDPGDQAELQYSWVVSGESSTIAGGETASPSITFTNNGEYTITATIDDGDGGIIELTHTIAVHNLPPVITLHEELAALRGEVFEYQGTFIDPGQDAWAAIVDFGDGTGPQPAVAVSRTFALQHSYANEGVYSITLTVDDGDGGAHTVTESITVSVAGIQEDGPGQYKLVVGGTVGADVVTLYRTTEGIQVLADGEDAGTYAGTFSRIVIRAGDGNDLLLASSNIGSLCEFYGGDGNDVLDAGNSGGILVGGAGNDLLLGGAGRDLLIGGPGADILTGNPGDDILIAGFTDHDEQPEALRAILAEWMRTDLSYQARVSRISAGIGTDQVFALNASTVHDDTGEDQFAFDLLVGGSGEDWLFANRAGNGVRDLIIASSSSEVRTDI